jgi:hypothetical protein
LRRALAAADSFAASVSAAEKGLRRAHALLFRVPGAGPSLADALLGLVDYGELQQSEGKQQQQQQQQPEGGRLLRCAGGGVGVINDADKRALFAFFDDEHRRATSRAGEHDPASVGEAAGPASLDGDGGSGGGSGGGGGGGGAGDGAATAGVAAADAGPDRAAVVAQMGCCPPMEREYIVRLGGSGGGSSVARLGAAVHEAGGFPVKTRSLRLALCIDIFIRPEFLL